MSGVLRFDMATKACGKCLVELPRTEFYTSTVNSDGLRGQCKRCVRDASREYHATNFNRLRPIRKLWREKNRDRANLVEAARIQRNLEQIKSRRMSWYEANRERILAAQKQYMAANPHLSRSRAAKHRAAKKRATPQWANHAYVRLFYGLAVLEQKRTGKQCHVDHIVPLQSKVVCGLHHEHNLQILFGDANRSKSNRIWPDMP